MTLLSDKEGEMAAVALVPFPGKKRLLFHCQSELTRARRSSSRVRGYQTSFFMIPFEQVSKHRAGSKIFLS